MSVTCLLVITLIFKNDIDTLLDLITGYYYNKSLCESIVLITKSICLLAINYFVGGGSR